MPVRFPEGSDRFRSFFRDVGSPVDWWVDRHFPVAEFVAVSPLLRGMLRAACRAGNGFWERRRFAFISGGVAGNCWKSLKDCDIGLSSGKSLGIRNLLRTFEN